MTSEPAPIGCDDVRFFASLASKSGSLVAIGDQVAIAHHQVLELAPEDKWSTDEDAFGILMLDARAGTIQLRDLPIPLRFPIKPTGANGARREFELEVHASGAILCSLVSPFSDARGWGKDVFLFRLDLRTERWDRLVHTKDGRVESSPLGDPVEPPELRFGGGEPCFSLGPAGEVRVAMDITAYHLEDSTRAVTNAIDLGLVAEPKQRRYSSGSSLDWSLHSAGAPSLELQGFDAYLRARPELAAAGVSETFVLRGTELLIKGDRHLVVLARAFIDRAPFRDFLMVVPLPPLGQ